MSAVEQLNNFQSKAKEQFAQVKKAAQARAKELEGEAKKALELLGDRAQVELGQLLAHAQGSTRAQWSRLGAELVKLGEKLQQLAAEQAQAAAQTVADAAHEVADAAAAEAEKIRDATSVN